MTKQLDIGVLGADGRMGGAIIRSLEAEPRARLTAAVTAKDSPHLGKDAAEVVGLRPCGVDLSADIHAALDKCDVLIDCLLYTSPSPRDGLLSRMPSSA